MKKIIGTIVSGVVDRPLGSHHPKHPHIIYPINYGYVEGVLGGDGEEQDAYILGIDKPIDRFIGKVIAIYHRLNDNEDKWIVALDNKEYTDEEILAVINFQERYFKGELIR